MALFRGRDLHDADPAPVDGAHAPQRGGIGERGARGAMRSPRVAQPRADLADQRGPGEELEVIVVTALDGHEANPGGSTRPGGACAGGK